MSAEVNRYLITTADERTWKFDRPVLFLGEWCRLYCRRSTWEGMDAVVATPYGLQSGLKERDLAYVEELANRLLEELVEALNRFHVTRHSVRYWQITLGHWLQRYVAVMFNRYFTLEQALANHAVSGTTVLDPNVSCLAKADSLAFVWACNDAVFNNILYGNILRSWGLVKTEVVSDSASSACRPVSGRPLDTPGTAGSRVKHVAMDAARGVLPVFSRRRDAVVINSYLPKMKEAQLQIVLGQCPQWWRSPRVPATEPDPVRRRTLSVGAANHEGFERHVRAQLPDVIPTCYLEGYGDLVSHAGRLGWPSRPKFIFTSNNFDTDEVFKVWAASKVQEGIPYFVGQHGNNYGTLSGSLNWPELVTCDKFFTWGWTNENPRNVPAFIFKMAGRSVRRKPAINGGLLLIEMPLPHLISPWDSVYEFGTYQQEQFRFADALPQAIHGKLTVRLHAAWRRLDWSDDQRWRDRSPHTRVESGAAGITALLRNSRLVVHSYDSTGLLETLATNIPTMCFWHCGFDQVMPSAKPYYELLKGAGIFHATPEAAAEAIAGNWNGIEGWWESRQVQDARAAFCDRYARTAESPVRTMKRLLTTHAAEATAPIDGGGGLWGRAQ